MNATSVFVSQIHKCNFSINKKITHLFSEQLRVCALHQSSQGTDGKYHGAHEGKELKKQTGDKGFFIAAPEVVVFKTFSLLHFFLGKFERVLKKNTDHEKKHLHCDDLLLPAAIQLICESSL